MKSPVAPKTIQAGLLFACTVLAFATAAQAEAQQTPRPSITTLTRDAQNSPKDVVLLQCGTAHYKATTQWTGRTENYVAKFENRAAQAVCGNAVYDATGFSSDTNLSGDKISRVSLKPVESYNNASFNVSALFNPGLRQIIRKGRTDQFACRGQLGQAEALEIHENGLVSLKFADPKLEAICGQGRYLSIPKLAKEKLQILKHPQKAEPVLFSRSGFMECGTSYYAARLDYASASNDVTAHFNNPKAEAVCGNAIYDESELTATRGPISTTFARFVERQKHPGFLDNTTYSRGQILEKVACRNNLGAAQVIDTAPAYGLVALHFANPQLEALCGQGRYYFADKSISNYNIKVEKLSNATRALAERQAMGQVNYFSH